MAKPAFDPAKVKGIFKLIAQVKKDMEDGDFLAAINNLITALQYFLETTLLKAEKTQVEQAFYIIEKAMAQNKKFVQEFGQVSFLRGEHQVNIDYLFQLRDAKRESINEKLRRGLGLLADKNFEKAWVAFMGVVNDVNCETDHLITIGDAYLNIQRWNEAQKIFTIATTRDPDSVFILNRMAISLRKDKKYKEALTSYTKALLLSPLDENLHFNVARLFIEMGDLANAEKSLQRALSLNPEFERATKLLDGVQGTLAHEKC
ncbi:MAG: tetratricopeptide repeat protein [Deltaproteobacteria bacterium]|nr:tetratricopeptide repeat protein [Deltaproteobacteria bacterium]